MSTTHFSGPLVVGPNETAATVSGTGGLQIVSGNLQLDSGSVVMTSGSQTLTSGDITLTSGNATLTAGNLLLTSGNATLTSGNVLLTAGNLTVTSGTIKHTAGLMSRSCASITAGTTQTQAGATAIITNIVYVTTGNASDGIILPALSSALIGTQITVINASANAGVIYCPGTTSTNTINGTAGATGVAYAASKTLNLTAVSATAWVSNLSN